MKLAFHGDKLLVGQALRGKAELRLGLLLGRFGDEVGMVTLRLSKAKDARGQPGNRCQIAVGLRPRRVEVEYIDRDLLVAFDRAVDKAVRSVTRVLRRELEESLEMSSSASRVLETARSLAAAQVLRTAVALKGLRTPKADRVLEAARVVAADRVLATAKALQSSRSPEAARALEAARVVAAKRVLDTARVLARKEKAPAPR